MNNRSALKEYLKRIKNTRQALALLSEMKDVYIGRYPVTVRIFKQSPKRGGKA